MDCSRLVVMAKIPPSLLEQQRPRRSPLAQLAPLSSACVFLATAAHPKPPKLHGLSEGETKANCGSAHRQRRCSGFKILCDVSGPPAHLQLISRVAAPPTRYGSHLDWLRQKWRVFRLCFLYDRRLMIYRARLAGWLAGWLAVRALRVTSRTLFPPVSGFEDGLAPHKYWVRVFDCCSSQVFIGARAGICGMWDRS